MITTTAPVLDAINDTLDIIDWSLENEGGTFDLFTGQPLELDYGYLVSLEGGTIHPLEDLDTMSIMMDIGRMTERALRERPTESGYIGTWVHENQLYLDTTVWVRSMEEALIIGQANNQLTIWNCQASQAIDITIPANPVDYPIYPSGA